MATRDEHAGEKQIDRGTLERLAEQRSTGLLREYWDFLRYTGKWWLVPGILALVFIGGLAVLAGTGAAPFIYALF